MNNAMAPAISQSDPLDPARAEALLVSLGNPRGIGTGDPLPPFFHQLYFWTPQPPEALGRDGHPKVGGLIPDLGLPRRMWGGGRLRFHQPLRAGLPALRKSQCERSETKTGRSGPLGRVTLRHDFYQEEALCLTEWQELIYRPEASPARATQVPPEAPEGAQETREVRFDTTLLFRYSALTFNGHRIHYDLEYAREVEGYSGLVVHGPLLAQHLMLMAEGALGLLVGFEYRATSPLMHWETATLCRRKSTLWVRGSDGRLCMEAKATAAD
jgi:3-methylfumaryl-CoA hydratase